MNPPIHPICRLFPRMSEEELHRPAEDILRRGELLEPIVLHQGAVLDGRHRLQACELAGVEPRFIEWEGEGSSVAWVIAKNLRRRHFSASQRAVLALQVLPHLEAEARERRREGARNSRRAQNCALLERPARRKKITVAGEAARLLGASPRYVQAARRLDHLCPSLIPVVMEGRMALCQALRAAKLDGGTLRRVLEKIA
ncbi:MAG: ParB N-terminal domain-containing protein, partial [Planctomycetes bacterium]|nr:ParB N-terminal domain-containing protein [Planctomycetota bacterium]